MLSFKRNFLIPAGGTVENALVDSPISNLPWPAAVQFWAVADLNGLEASVRVDELQTCEAARINLDATLLIDKLRDSFATTMGEKRAQVNLFLRNPAVTPQNVTVLVEATPI